MLCMPAGRPLWELQRPSWSDGKNGTGSPAPSPHALDIPVSIRRLSSPSCPSQSVSSDTPEWNVSGVVHDIQNPLFPSGGWFSYPLANLGRVQNLGVAAGGDPGWPCQEGDLCSCTSGKARRDATSGSLVATTLGEDHAGQNLASWGRSWFEVSLWPYPLEFSLLPVPYKAETGGAAVLVPLTHLSSLWASWPGHSTHQHPYTGMHTQTHTHSPSIFAALHAHGCHWLGLWSQLHWCKSGKCQRMMLGRRQNRHWAEDVLAGSSHWNLE